MGGGGSETIVSAQVIGLSKKFGALKKKILLENGKYISSGMNVVIAARGKSIVDIKSMYNKKYLEAMGYAPSVNILIDKISEGKVLEYTKNNIDSMTIYISNLEVNTLGTLDQAILELQVKPNFKRSEMSFTHTDSKKYYYFTSVQNGTYIDISCYLNDEDTVIPYLENKYPEGYAILNRSAYPLVENGMVYWKVEVEYIYYEDEEVNGEIVTLQKLGLTTEYIDCIFIYFTVLDSEEAQMYAIAQQHSGPFTTTGTYIDEGDGVDNPGGTETVTVYGTFTVTYIGNGEFSYNMNAPDPYPSSPILILPKNKAWKNGVRGYQAQKVNQVTQAVINNVKKLIWDYGVDREDIDSVKRTFVLGNILNSFIVKEQADTYPIIPLKRNFNLVNSKKMDIVLKKIGLEGKDFHDGIRQEEICDAYLFFGVPFNSSNPGLIQYIFEFFTTLSNVRENYSKYNQSRGSNLLNISLDGMGIYQNYTVQSWIVVEPATRPVGTYWIQNRVETIITGYEGTPVFDENGVSNRGVLPTTTVTRTYVEYYYQESEAYYIRIKPIVNQYWYTLGGRQWGSAGRRKIGDPAEGGGVVSGSEDNVELRLPILKQITNKIHFNLLCDVIEQSMSFAVYTEVVVKLKWYQTGLFQFIMMAVIIVVTIVTGGVAAGLMSFLLAAAGDKLGVFGQILGIVLIVMGGYAALTNSASTLTLTQTVMYTASQVLNLVSQVNNLFFSVKMDSKQKDYNNQLKQQEEEKEKLANEYEKLHENQGMIVDIFNNFKTLDDIDNYYNMATSNFDSYSLMLEYATDYDKFYILK